MMWWHDGWGPAAWGGFALIHMVLWLLIVSGIAVLVLRGLGIGFWHGRHARDDRALEILRERYARGEISKEEFEERKMVLKN